MIRKAHLDDTQFNQLVEALTKTDYETIYYSVGSALFAVFAGFLAQWVFEYRKNKKDERAHFEEAVAQHNVIMIRLKTYFERFSGSIKDNYMPALDGSASAYLAVNDELGDFGDFIAEDFKGLLHVHPAMEEMKLDEALSLIRGIKYPKEVFEALIWAGSYIRQLNAISAMRLEIMQELPVSKPAMVDRELLKYTVMRLLTINRRIIILCSVALEALLRANTEITKMKKSYIGKGVYSIDLPDVYDTLYDELIDLLKSFDDVPEYMILPKPK